MLKKNAYRKIVDKIRCLKIFFCALVLTLFNSCETYFDSGPATVTIESENDEILTKGWSLAAFPETDSPYLYVTDNDQVVLAKDKDLNGIVDGVYLSSGNKSVLIEFDEKTKLPQILATLNNEYIVFSFNEELTNLDIAFIHSDESISYANEIPINSDDYSFDSFDSAGKGSNQGDLATGFASVGKITSFMVSALSCGLTAAAALGLSVPSFGASLLSGGAAAILSCSAAAFSLADTSLSLAKYSGNVVIPEGTFMMFTLNGVLFDAVQCLGVKDPFACTNLFLNSVSSISDAMIDKRENKQELIEEVKIRLKNFQTDEWYVAEYELGPITPTSECGTQVGEKGHIYFYLNPTEHTNKYSVYIKSIISTMPDIYCSSDFEPDLTAANLTYLNGIREDLNPTVETPYTEIFIQYFRLRERTYILTDAINSLITVLDNNSPENCNGQSRYWLSFQANYIGKVPPTELTGSEIEKMQSIIANPYTFVLVE